MTLEVCCDMTKGPQGNLVCWDETYTFARCCGRSIDQLQTGEASGDLSTLKVDPATVQLLPLHGAGSMPMSGMGLCCRTSAQGDAVRQGVLDYLLLGGRHLDDAMLYNNHREVGAGVRQALEL